MRSMRKIRRIVIKMTGLCFFYPLAGWAQAYHVYTSKPQGIGSMATSMLAPIDMLRQLMNAASIIVGIYMLISAFTRYLRFRQNPQESPLSTVFFWGVLGAILIIIPLAYHFAMMAAGNTGMGDVT